MDGPRPRERPPVTHSPKRRSARPCACSAPCWASGSGSSTTRTARRGWRRWRRGGAARCLPLFSLSFFPARASPVCFPLFWSLKRVQLLRQFLRFRQWIPLRIHWSSRQVEPSASGRPKDCKGNSGNLQQGSRMWLVHFNRLVSGFHLFRF